MADPRTFLGQAQSVALTGLPFTTGGHYSASHRCALVASQGANTRVFEILNLSATILAVITQLNIQWIQTGACTALDHTSLDCYKVTGATVADTTNKVDLAPSVMRTAQMVAAASAVAIVKGVTVAGAANGMTGGTMTKDSSPISQLPQVFVATLPTAGTIIPMTMTSWATDLEYPLVLGANEGIIIESRASLAATHASMVYIDVSYVETTVV